VISVSTDTGNSETSGAVSSLLKIEIILKRAINSFDSSHL